MAAKIERLPFFLGTLLDPVVPLVLELPKCVAPKPLTELALKPEFDWVVVYKLAALPEFYEGFELAITQAQRGEQASYPELNEVSKLAIH
jgi:hypothetical protein